MKKDNTFAIRMFSIAGGISLVGMLSAILLHVLNPQPFDIDTILGFTSATIFCFLPVFVNRRQRLKSS